DQDQLLDLVVHFHDFIQSSAPLVPGVVAYAATFALLNLDGLCLIRGVALFDQRLHGDVNRLCTFLADSAHQSLGADEVDGSGHQEGLNAHVHETRNGFRSAVRVQSRKNQVAGERCLDGNLRGLKISNFAHQNDVGILSQEGSQGSRKVQANLLFHLHLVDAAQLELDRIFGGHDVGIGRIQARNRRIQSVGLTGTCGPGHQHHAVGLQNRLLELDQRLGLETELGHVKSQVLLIEQPEYDLLAPQRRKRAHAEVELLFLPSDIHLQHDAAVLRKPLLADVQLGHDFQAGGYRILQFQRRRHDRLQHTVNTEPNSKFLFVRLNMNVAGPALDCVREHQVHELHNGSLVGSLLEVRKIHFGLFSLQFDVGVFQLRHRLHHLLKVFFLAGAVRFFDTFENCVFRRHYRLNVETGHELDIIHREHVRRINHCDGQRCA